MAVLEHVARARAAARKPRRKRASKPAPGGQRFRNDGFYVEGRHFSLAEDARALDFACAFAARLVEEYRRPVRVMLAQLCTGPEVCMTCGTRREDI